MTFGLFFLASPPQASAWWDNHAPTGSEAALGRWCDQRLSHVNELSRESDALACVEFYFFHQALENDGEVFEKPLRFLHRAIELEPSNFDSQTTAIWLHYSQWRASQLYPTEYGQYSDELENTYAIANAAENTFANNPQALMAIADQLSPILHFYDRSLFTQIERLYNRAQSISTDINLVVMGRLNIAYIYRLYGDINDAIAKYKWALEADANNKVAIRYLKLLQTPKLVRVNQH